jgi:hypothetical protein
MNHVLRQPAQRFPVVFVDDHFIVNRKTGMMPEIRSLFNGRRQAAPLPAPFLHHGEDLFTEYDGCLVNADSRKRMEPTSKVKHAIGKSKHTMESFVFVVKYTMP